jgi:hypothetical protein
MVNFILLLQATNKINTAQHSWTTATAKAVQRFVLVVRKDAARSLSSTAGGASSPTVPAGKRRQHLKRPRDMLVDKQISGQQDRGW